MNIADGKPVLLKAEICVIIGGTAQFPIALALMFFKA
jgi:hypothetical protein